MLVTLVKLLQPPNAESPMLVTPLPIVTLVRLVQSLKAAVPDAGDAVGDVRLSGWYIIERIIADAGDAVADRDAGQTATALERRVSDVGDAIANRDAGQAGAVIERIVPDAGDAVGDRHAGQAGAVIERIIADAGDAVADRDAGQAACSPPNAASPMLVTPLPIVTLVSLVQSTER